MAYIGAKNLHVFKLTTENDTDTKTVYGDMKKLSPLIKATVNLKTAEAELWGDNRQVYKHFEITGADITIEAADLTLEEKALLLGCKYDSAKGILKVSADDDAPYFGVAMESTRSDGKAEYLFLTKVKFAPMNMEFETKGTNLAYKTPSFTGTAVARPSDGVVYLQGDDKAKESWYKADTFSVGKEL